MITHLTQANAQVIFGRTLFGLWLAFLTTGLNIDWRKNTLSQNTTGIPVGDPNNGGYRGNLQLHEFDLIVVADDKSPFTNVYN
jgi:hypothetical protein